MIAHRRWRQWSAIAVALCLLCLAQLAVSVGFGIRSVALTPDLVFQALTNEAAPRLDVVAVNTRLPRALLGLGVGVVLGAAGALLQALYRNPLASPEITGVTQGALTAAVVWLTFGPQLPTGEVSWALPAIAAVGASIAGIATWTVTRVGGRVSATRMVLMGVLVGGVLNACTSICLLFAGESVQVLVEWLSGSLAFATWAKVRLFAIAALVSLSLLAFAIPRANLIQLGDDVSSGLGQAADRTRIVVLFTAASLTAAAVCIVGGIGFVGLVAPHLVRRVVGTDLRRLVPASALAGACLVLLADLVARNSLPGPFGLQFGLTFNAITLPVGVFLALLGGPFFLVLLRRAR